MKIKTFRSAGFNFSKRVPGTKQFLFGLSIYLATRFCYKNNFMRTSSLDFKPTLSNIL